MTATTGDSIVRIPNLPIDKLVDEQGMPTPSEETFRQTLITNLQNLFGTEGCVVPTQDPTSLTTIQNNIIVNQSTDVAQFSCLPGTILYVQHPTDYTQDKVMIAVRNSNDYPLTAPVFKTVTLT